jgi:hypothetical protein
MELRRGVGLRNWTGDMLRSPAVAAVYDRRYSRNRPPNLIVQIITRDGITSRPSRIDGQPHKAKTPAVSLRCVIPLVLLAAVSCASASDLDEQFHNPPPDVRPWVFWMWLRADTTPAAITKDLEEMKAKGIPGFILYDAGAGVLLHADSKMVLDGKAYRSVRTDDFKGATSTPIPTGPLPTWSPRWRELIRFVAKEAARLHLEFCLTDGLASTSGSIDEADGQQKLIWSETKVAGPMVVDALLPLETGKASQLSSHRDVSVLAVPDTPDFGPGRVVDLSAKMDAAGHLHWDAPAGAWKVLRFSQTPTHARNFWGLFTDGMSAEALDKTWEVTMAPLLREMTPEERAGLRGIEDDSWEAGDMTWTGRFAAEFQRRRGYDLVPWLPVLAGVKMGDPADAAGVWRDYRLTISDLVADNHYAHLRQLAHQNGLTLYSEAAGPHPTQQDLLKNCGQVDIAMAEFWMPSPHRPTPQTRFLLRDAASANHIYGKPVTMCESFTSAGPFWEETFFSMKATADQAFCDGLNRVCFHNFSHSPSLDAKPGYVYFAGTLYGRNVTWWDQTPAFNTYLARCSELLQQGKFVADALFYHGDGIGQLEQMKTVPATLGEGYDHDNVNTDVLLTRANVRDGRIVLSDGMNYRVLVLPENTPMAPAVLAKISALVEAGATVVGPRPSGFAGLPLHPEDRPKFDSLVARLWGKTDARAVTENRVGAGRVVWGPSVREVLQSMGAGPDFEQTGVSPAGTIDWIHRTAGGAEIYYVASRWEPAEKVACTFRVSGKQPELWNPVTGEIRDARAFRQEGGRTTVPLEFDPCGSVFVVFRKDIKPDAQGLAATNYPATSVVTRLNGPWEVSFDPKWGGPAQVTFDQLTDWTKRPEEGIKFYSGTAVYRQEFDLGASPAPGERLLLDLGEVHEISSVRLNGIDLGVVWAKPARVDITPAVKAGANALEITVVNLWPNRLIGDAGLPPEKRFTETNMHKFTAATPLLASGLLGPVEVLASAPP